VPAEIVDEIANEALEMTAYEDFVIERVRGGQKTLGLYPATDEANLAAFDTWRKTNRR
jgi:regulator of RNase E activity RraA